MLLSWCAAPWHHCLAASRLKWHFFLSQDRPTGCVGQYRPNPPPRLVMGKHCCARSRASGCTAGAPLPARCVQHLSREARGFAQLLCVAYILRTCSLEAVACAGPTACGRPAAAPVVAPAAPDAGESKSPHHHRRLSAITRGHCCLRRVAGAIHHIGLCWALAG